MIMHKFDIGDTVYTEKGKTTITGITINRKNKVSYALLNGEYKCEVEISKELPVFKRWVPEKYETFCILDKFETIERNLFVSPTYLYEKTYSVYNLFQTKEEAEYVRDNMNGKLLRAIWQWKYWNDRDTGAFFIEVQFGTPVANATTDEEPLYPTFTTVEKAKECIKYLKQEGLIK